MNKNHDPQLIAEIFNLIYENASFGMLELAADLRIVRANPYFQKLTGYSESELQKLTAVDLTEDDFAEVKGRMDQSIETGDFRPRLRKIRAKGGAGFWINVQGGVVRPAGAAPFVFIICENVTEQYERGRRVRLSRDIDRIIAGATKLQETIERIMMTLADYSDGQVVNFWKPNEQGELLMEQSFTFAPERYQGFIERSRQYKFDGGKGLPGRIAKSRRPEWIELISEDSNFLRAQVAREFGLLCGFGFPVLFEDRVIGVMEIFNNISRPIDESLLEYFEQLSARLGLVFNRLKRSAEVARVRAELEEFRAAIHSFAIVEVCDLNGVLLEVNDLACQALGYERGEMLGRNMSELRSSVHSREFYDALWATIRGGEVWVGEMCRRRKDGSDLWTFTSIKGMHDVDGVLNRFLTLRFDISHAKMAEERLVHATKMAALGEMAANIAHEINSPLVALVSRAKLILNSIEAGKHDDSSTVAAVEQILVTADRVMQIATGLKTISRAADADDFQTVGLRGLINDTLSFCRERLDSSGVRLELSELPEVSLCCRPAQLSQVIVNLLNNSCDAIASLSNKWVRIEAKVVDSSRLEISVTDSGPGILPEIAEKIMKPFFTTKGVNKGTGLGLSVSASIAEVHGGKFYLDRDCKNTCFVLVLPLAASSKIVN